MNCIWRAHTRWWYNRSLFFPPTTLLNPLAEPPAFWQDRTWTSLKKKKKKKGNLLLRTICRVKIASSCHLQISSHIRGYECDSFRDIFSPYSSSSLNSNGWERPETRAGFMVPQERPLVGARCAHDGSHCLAPSNLSQKKKKKEFWGGHENSFQWLKTM